MNSDKLLLYLPFPLSTVAQKFGKNANPLYAGQGLKGHTAYDFAVPWGTPVRACVDGPVYSVMHKGDLDTSQYRAVFQLVQVGNIFYEVSYGHMDDIYVEPLQTVKAGDIIGTVGNTGPVYSNGVAVPREPRLAGSHDGAHLHGPQVRPTRRVKVTAGGLPLSDGFGVLRDAEGYYYEVLDYNNGYNGCVDPGPLFDTLTADKASQVNLIKAAIARLTIAVAAYIASYKQTSA
jgi:murein DD-endopeptidase MepM/ murein hydrolase activator NlpD